MKRHAAVTLLLCAALGSAGAAGKTDVRRLRPSDYALSFDVFVGSGELDDAYRVARLAVARSPGDLQWRRRLARVASWTQRPRTSYENWKYLYDHGARDREVMEAVQRLAPYVNDYATLIHIWQEAARRKPLAPEQWRDVASMYEKANTPIEGARFFERSYQRGHDPALGELAARLYLHAGRDDDAERLYRQLLARHTPQSEWVMQLAMLELRRDRYRDTFTLLDRYRAQMPDDAYDYWRLLGDLAWTLQQDEAAQVAYRHVVADPKASKIEMDRLMALMLPRDPLAAAALARRFYRNTGKAEWAQRAFEIYMGAKEYTGAHQLLAALDGPTRRALEKLPPFLLLRSQLRRQDGDTAGAVADVSLALRLQPDDADLQINALWLFVETRRKDELAALLPMVQGNAMDDDRYWPACAAAYQELEQPRPAAEYYRRQLRRTPDDPMLLLNYADVLEQLHYTGMAMRIRRHVWLRLQQQPGGEATAAGQRLTLAPSAGDAVFRRVRRWAAHQQQLQRPSGEEENLDELLLGWALEKEWNDTARGWIEQRFGQRGKAAPVWAELQLALAQNDTATLQQLLDRAGQQIPAAGGYDSAHQLGEEQLAVDYAFEGLRRNGDDEELHWRYLDAMAQSVSWVELTGAQEQYELFERSITGVGAGLPVGKQTRLLLRAQSAVQSSRDQEQAPFVPKTDKRSSVALRWSGRADSLQLTLHSAQELGSYNGWQARYGHDLSRRLHIDLAADVHADADESTALQLGGMEDRLALTVAYAPDKRWYGSLTPSSARYHTQNGAYLGSGERLEWELGFRVRSEYPDWNLRLDGSHSRFKVDGNPDAASLVLFSATDLADTAADARAALFLPLNVDYYSACAGAGQYLLDETFSRGWRPLADLCFTNNSRSGNGYSAQFGLVGSLDGADRVTLSAIRSKGGVQTDNRETLFLSLGYRRYF